MGNAENSALPQMSHRAQIANPFRAMVFGAMADEMIAACEKALRDAHLPQNIVVDCSHGNSGKKPERQGPVLLDVLSQLEAGNRSIRGFMLESNLEGGNQPMQTNPALLNPRCSITDACIDWSTTETLLREAHRRIGKLIRQESK